MSLDPPWVMRTYSGHSTPRATNELYRTNLAKGQTGLSVAFDLPTQIGYDPDDPDARGEVGKVGVPIAHLGHMEELLDGIDLASMNTSMTINASASWLLALYVALADRRGVPRPSLSGTTQNDIVKEYLSRGTYIFGPAESRRLIVDMIAFTVREVPRWNPINVCSYHLQEAGATPVQELAFALATAIGVLDAARLVVTESEFPAVVGRISFFVNAGIRFIEEMCKMRAFTTMWDRICATRYGITDPKLRRFRYGMQVNSLGLTEAEPENNVQRIILEMLGVTLSRDARARAVQLPTWNEALGLPRPWDQQWSLRYQQVLAYETDLLEYADIFNGSHVITSLTESLIDSATAELDSILAMGGVWESVEEMKSRLVTSQAERSRRIETGEQPVVGVNKFASAAFASEPSPLGGPADSILRVDPALEAALATDVAAWRSTHEVGAAMVALEKAARSDDNIMPATIALAMAGGTTGQWGTVMRSVLGEYRAPTGVAAAVGHRGSLLYEVAARVRALPGGPPRLLVAKPGLDGHSNGAEQIAVAARDAGMEVVYQGIRSTVPQIAASAAEEDVELVGISILSGSHLSLMPSLLAALAEAGVDAPVVVGGIIPPDDEARLRAMGVAAVYTPKDFELARIMGELVDLVVARRGVTVGLG